MDRIVIVVALGGAFVRFGNFMNSEIIGKPSNSDQGVFFARDVIERLEYEKYIDKVSIIHSTKKAASDSLKYPVDIRVVFKKGNVEEDYVNAYLSMQIKQILVSSEYVKMQIAEPANLPLDYSLTKNNHGNYEAVIHSYAIPRHPAQLYESASCIFLFIILFTLWKLRWRVIADGRIFGIFLVILFTLRFLYEFLKVNQVSFEDNMSLNMGQWLSIPLVVFGLYLLLRKGKNSQMPTLPV